MVAGRHCHQTLARFVPNYAGGFRAARHFLLTEMVGMYTLRS